MIDEDYLRGEWITIPKIIRDRLVVRCNSLAVQKNFYRVLFWVFGVALLSVGLFAVGSTRCCMHKGELVASLSQDLQDTREDYERSSTALGALARSHEDILNAKEQVNTVGDKSWGRKFTVTKYYPPAGGINSDRDPKHTATMAKADPKSRIVAVDPGLIPYGSWVWVEDEGWYNAQDCGGLIKGFRIDIMAAKLRDAKEFGKQEKFVLVVPKSV